MIRILAITSVLILLSACSSQAVTQVSLNIVDAVLQNDSSPYDLQYDESKIFPASNQRLACQLDAGCDKPLSAIEFERLSEKEQLLAIYGDK